MPHAHLSEVFRIVEGALRLDGVKVRNYAALLAEKLVADGENGSAQRLKKILEEQSSPLRPTKLQQEAPTPVDGESRFPLVHRLATGKNSDAYVFAESQEIYIKEYLTVVRARGTLESKGIISSTNLLLYGPPGCGKTHLALYIARQLSLPIYVARLDGLISSFLGSTAKNIRAVFDFATKTPCVLLLDEFDAVAKLRDDQQELGELKRVVNSFIQNLDALGNDVTLIAATNHEQLLDPAVWRRFPFLLRIGLPNHEQRQNMWSAFSGEIEWDKKQLWILADLSEGFTGASIESASLRLRQIKITMGVKPTVRRALAVLASSAPSTGEPRFLSESVLNDPRRLVSVLKERDPHSYTGSTIAEVLGVSKATVSRRTRSRTTTKGIGNVGREALHKGGAAKASGGEKKAGRRGKSETV